MDYADKLDMMDDECYIEGFSLEDATEIQVWQSECVRQMKQLELAYAKLIPVYEGELARAKAERDALVETIRKRLHALSYESAEWTHGEHPRVVELDEIDDLLDEFVELEEGDDE